MSNSTFLHHDLKLLNPSFDSSLVDILTELEHLRRYRLDDGSTPTYILMSCEIFSISSKVYRLLVSKEIIRL